MVGLKYSIFPLSERRINTMLKLVGTEKGKVMDEKVLITEEGKPSKWLIRFICIDVIVDAIVFCLINRIRAKFRK